MSKFINILESLKIEQENKLILEFANLDPSDHRLGTDLIMRIMQPGDQPLKHGARAKFFSPKSTSQFVITIGNYPKVIGNYHELISDSELNKLIKNIELFKIPLLNFWHDSTMTTKTLQQQMDMIRQGEEVQPTYIDKINRTKKKK